MRTILLKQVDRFFCAVDRWSRMLAWVAVVAAVAFILVPEIIKIMGR